MDETGNLSPVAGLSAEPTMLDFGPVDPEKSGGLQAKAEIRIRNTGDRILVGTISVQVAWITVSPVEFRLQPGEHSVHTFTMTDLAPAVWTSHRMGSDFIALISSNGGNETIGGYYYTPQEIRHRERKKPGVRLRTLFTITGLAVLAAGSVLGVSRFLGYEDEMIRTSTAAESTSIVETDIVKSTLYAPTPTSLMAYLDDDAFNATAAAIGESLILNISAVEPTFTPWPAGKYPSAQQFLFSYYMYLNERDFDHAWWLLSESMQRACCYEGAGTPIENYRELMSDVSTYELVSAYLQANDVNPAEVRFELITHKKNGTMSDNIFTAYIIDDEMRNTLLIDEIK